MKKLDLEKLSYEINRVDLQKASKYVGGSSSSTSGGSAMGGNNATGSMDEMEEDDNNNNYVYNDGAPGDYYDDNGACVDYACADLVDFEAALAVNDFVDFNDIYEIGVYTYTEDYGSLA